MSDAVVGYLRRHHLAMVAIVIALAGGVAYAASLPRNSVRSKQIKNGQVKSVDVKDAGLSGKDIADGSLTGAQIADGSLTGAKIADGSVGPGDLEQGTIADVRSARVTFDDDSQFHDVLTIPGFGVLAAQCTSIDEVVLQYRNTTQGSQGAFLSATDASGTEVDHDSSLAPTDAVFLQQPSAATGSLQADRAGDLVSVSYSIAREAGQCEFWGQAVIDS